MKRATIRFVVFPLERGISIHALMKRATGDRSYSGAKLVISIHALMKRATRFIVYIILRHCISIHALMKRATYPVCWECAHKYISIHALMKRARKSAEEGNRVDLGGRRILKKKTTK